MASSASVDQLNDYREIKAEMSTFGQRKGAWGMLSVGLCVFFNILIPVREAIVIAWVVAHVLLYSYWEKLLLAAFQVMHSKYC